MSVYSDVIKPRLDLIEEWACNGLSNDQIISNLNIGKTTFYRLINSNKELKERLKKGRASAISQVENALFERTQGKIVTLKRPIKTKRVIYVDGKKAEEFEEVIYADYEDYVAPDTTSQIFFLKNRNPEDWRDKQETDVNLSGDIKFKISVIDDKNDKNNAP